MVCASNRGDALANRTPPIRRRQKAANLSIDASLLVKPRRLKLNLSRVLEDGLAAAIRRHEAEEWLRRKSWISRTSAGRSLQRWISPSPESEKQEFGL
jgi:post-segregation antitoxin (ccd killing protein)